MKKKNSSSYLLLIFLIFIVIFSSLFFPTCKKEELNPGTEKDTTGSIILTAFINDDKYEDSVIIKPIAKFEKFNNVTIVNLWDSTKVSSYGEQLSLRIKFGNVKEEFLIHDSSYFATPMWSSDSLPVRILNKNNKEFSEWNKTIPELNSDAIVLGTEAGIDILLYWNGYKFNLFWPDEEP